MQMEEVFETSRREDCEGAAMVALIKTANKSMSRLKSVNNPVTLSPKDKFAIKNKDKGWMCENEFVKDGMEMLVRYHDQLSWIDK